MISAAGHQADVIATAQKQAQRPVRDEGRQQQNGRAVPLDPLGVLSHPALTMTVEDPDAVERALTATGT